MPLLPEPDATRKRKTRPPDRVDGFAGEPKLIASGNAKNSSIETLIPMAIPIVCYGSRVSLPTRGTT
jgi:hypothetical protein